MSRLEKLLIQLLVFLIPTNLAYHWYYSGAYLNGHLVDYLLPKLYLSDLPALILIVIFIYKSLPLKLNKRLFLICLFPIYLIIRSIFTPFSLSSIWYTLKVIELMLLGSYLLTHPPKLLLKVIIAPLLLSLLFQSSLSLYQYISHSSLSGYYLLGESNLSSSNLAMTNWFGVLEVAPYGTTPHPNVLAGFLVFGIFVFLLNLSSKPSKNKSAAYKSLIIGLCFVNIVLIQSLAALVALIIGLGIYSIRNRISTQNILLILLMCAISTQILILLFLDTLHQSSLESDNASIEVRYELNRVGLILFTSNPFTGIGPNQFTRYLPQTTLSGQKTLILQPPHNMILIILTESGIIGFLLLGLSTITLISYSNLIKSPDPITRLLPLLALLLIGSLDHYPLTLQVGQLMLTLSMVLLLGRTNRLSDPFHH